jgi:hypothetical protein
MAFTTKFQQQVSGRKRLVLKFWLLLGTFAIAPQTYAAAIVPDFSTFTFSDTCGDPMTCNGFLTADFATNPLFFSLTGGNNGSNEPGFTYFFGTSVTGGTLTFQYNYSSLDSPGFDAAGYLLGSSMGLVEFQLADTDGTSCDSSSVPECSVVLTIDPGQQYGWYVDTFDNLVFPGVLNVTVIAGNGPAVPEPGGILLVFAGFAAIAVIRLRSVRAEPEESHES